MENDTIKFKNGHEISFAGLKAAFENRHSIQGYLKNTILGIDYANQESVGVVTSIRRRYVAKGIEPECIYEFISSDYQRLVAADFAGMPATTGWITYINKLAKAREAKNRTNIISRKSRSKMARRWK